MRKSAAEIQRAYRARKKVREAMLAQQRATGEGDGERSTGNTSSAPSHSEKEAQSEVGTPKQPDTGAGNTEQYGSTGNTSATTPSHSEREAPSKVDTPKQPDTGAENTERYRPKTLTPAERQRAYRARKKLEASLMQSNQVNLGQNHHTRISQTNQASIGQSYRAGLHGVERSQGGPRRHHNCSVCGKIFMHASSVPVHMRIHTGERPYKCDFCQKAFMYISSYSVHLVAAHKKALPSTMGGAEKSNRRTTKSSTHPINISKPTIKQPTNKPMPSINTQKSNATMSSVKTQYTNNVIVPQNTQSTNKAVAWLRNPQINMNISQSMTKSLHTALPQSSVSHSKSAIPKPHTSNVPSAAHSANTCTSEHGGPILNSHIQERIAQHPKTTSQHSTQKPSTQSPAYKLSTQSPVPKRSTQAHIPKPSAQSFAPKPSTQAPISRTVAPQPATQSSTPSSAQEPSAHISQNSAEAPSTHTPLYTAHKLIEQIKPTPINPDGQSVQGFGNTNITSASNVDAYGPSSLVLQNTEQNRITSPPEATGGLPNHSPNHVPSEYILGDAVVFQSTPDAYMVTPCGEGSKEQPQRSTVKHHGSDVRDVSSPDVLSARMKPKHIASLRPGFEKYQCGICKRHFPCNTQLIGHQRLHGITTGNGHRIGLMEAMRSTGQIHRCDVCNNVFTTRASLVNHNKVHARSDTSRCIKCNKYFKTYLHLRAHLKVLHQTNSYPCHECGKVFLRKFRLDYHMEMHPNHKVSHNSQESDEDETVPPIELSQQILQSDTLDTCTKSNNSKQRQGFSATTSIGDIYNVGSSNENSEQQNDVTVVAEQSSDNIAITNQAVVSETDGPQSWDRDDSATEKQVHGHSVHFEEDMTDGLPLLHKDMNVVHQGTQTNLHPNNRQALKHSPVSAGGNNQLEKTTYKCSICSKAFSTLDNFMRHRQSHQPGLKCTICYRVFRSRHGLNEHLKIHSNSKPFTCKFCGHTFRQGHHLKRHLTVHEHSDKKTHACSECCSYFMTDHMLRRHIIQVHWTNDDRLNKQKQEEFLKQKTLEYISSQKYPTVSTSRASPEMGHTCDICGAIFSRRYNLTHHIKRHIGLGQGDLSTANKIVGKYRPSFKQTHAKSQHLTIAKKSILKEKAPVLPPRAFQSDHFKSMTYKQLQEISIKIREFYYVPRSAITKTYTDPSSGRRYFVCEVCTTTFTLVENIMRHIRNRAFDHGYYLRKKEDGSRYLPPWYHTSRWKSQSRQHIKYPCMVCGTSFKDVNELQRHVETHGHSGSGTGLTGVPVSNTQPQEVNAEFGIVSSTTGLSEAGATINMGIQGANGDCEVYMDLDEVDTVEDNYGSIDQDMDSSQLGTVESDPDLNSASQTTNYKENTVQTGSEEKTDHGVTRNSNPRSTAQRPNDTIHNADAVEMNTVGETNSILTNDCSSVDATTKEANASVDVTATDTAELVCDVKLEVDAPPHDNETSQNLTHVQSSNETTLEYSSTASNLDMAAEIVGVCIDCGLPCVAGQMKLSCQLCCQTFCRNCTGLSGEACETALLERDNGINWMCKVCRPLFPKLTLLLEQLGDFEQVVNGRLADLEKSLLGVAKKALSQTKSCQ